MDAHEALITIRSAEPEDAPGIATLLGRPGTAENLLQVPDAPNASRLEYHQKLEPQGCRLVAVAGDEIVGSAGLHVQGASLRRMHVRGLGIAVAPQWQGRGIGRALMARLVDWADNWANVLRIELHVHADNPRARALYESFGFIEEGRHRGYALKGGQFVDSFSMARLHPSPPRLGG